MTDFVLLNWDVDDGMSAALRLQVGARLKSTRRWTLAREEPGLQLWLTHERPLAAWVSQDGRWLVLGDVFGASPAASTAPTPTRISQSLLERSWGRYVALFRNETGGLKAAFRDPSGTLDIILSRCGGLTIAASDLPQVLLAFLPGLAPDWGQVGAAMIDPLVLSGQAAITGLESVTPGALRSWQDGSSQEQQIWCPANFARRRLADTADTRAELVAQLDRCIEAYCGLGGDVVAELSGGLDSSTVATALIRAPSAKVVQWLHYYIDDPAGDERPYARAMAGKLGVALTEAHKPLGRLDHCAITDFAFGAKPSWRVVDGAYDRDLAQRVRDLGASRVMTGLGGDTVYMQGGDPWLGVEALGPGGDLRVLPRIARFAKRSTWEIALKGVRGLLGGGPTLQLPAPPFASIKARSALAREPGHPWLSGLDGVSPGKQQQILGLAHTMLIHGRSRRSRAADVVSPLMSQPIVELCLSLSSLAQTGAGDDRLMARNAFADRLAPEIIARRSKAGYGAFYGRMLAADLDELRALLLDGRLAQAGLLDTQALDETLTAETLIRRGPYREILNLTILEYWARSWCDALAAVATTREPVVQPG